VLAATSTTIRVRRADSSRDVNAFVRFPVRIYRDDPNWVAPIASLQRDKLDPKRNPFWRHATRTLFLALRGDEVVGTIAAIVDRNRLASAESEGMFGFFESIDEPAVARALLDAAARELRSQGIARMTGPFSPSASDEYGILVDGFDTRPALIEAHSPPYYGALMEACGMEKQRDAYAWLVKAKPGTRRAEELLPTRIGEVARRIRAASGVHTRSLDLTRFDDEIATVTRLFNASLATVPDFVPVAVDEFRALANSVKTFLDPDLVRFVERDGEPVAFALAIPDINEALQAARGSLFPTGAMKIWWKQRRLTRASFKILAVLPAYRHRGYDAVLVLDVAQAILDKGFTECDLSMTGEENAKINRYLQALGLEIYRRVRIYSRSV
jgi:GNAT superfamily N-acetyltransferase